MSIKTPPLKFQEHELVTWRYRTEQQQMIPVPAVVISHDESECVVIKARVQGSIQQLRVAPEQLSSR